MEIKGWLPERDKVKYWAVLLEHADKDIRMIVGKKEFTAFDTDKLLELSTMASTCA